MKANEMPHHWKVADKVLADHVDVGVIRGAIPEDKEENRAMLDRYLAGEKFEGVRVTKAGMRDPYGYLSPFITYLCIGGTSFRTLYRGTLFQCVIARDCFKFLREPFARCDYGSRPGEHRSSFFLTKEEDIAHRLKETGTREFFDWMIRHFVDAGLLKLRKLSGPTIRAERPVPGLLMQARLAERLDEIYNRLEGIEQLLSERLRDPDMVLLDQTSSDDDWAAVLSTGAPSPVNTKEPAPASHFGSPL